MNRTLINNNRDLYTVGVLLSCIVIISVEYFHLIILTLLVFNIYFKADKMNQN